MRPVYLDYNATTPLDPAVRAAMEPFFTEIFGNPSSIHQVGRRARAHLDDARDRVALVLGAKPSEIVFTGGGTESNNLAVCGAARLRRDRGRHLITSAVEHHAVLHPMEALAREEGFTLTVLTVNAAGRVDPADLRRALRPDTVLVSIQAANSEIGTLQPLAELGAMTRAHGALFHTDAAQWFGKEVFNHIGQFEADLVTLCAHKFHGPKGAGVLYVRSPLPLSPLLRGGSQENERRAGTENLPAIIGLAEAAERFLRAPVFDVAQMVMLRGKLEGKLASEPGVTLRTPPLGVLANTLAFTVAGTDSIALLAGLDLEGVCASSGSACSAGSVEPSHVMRALGVPPAEAASLVRLSLGRETTGPEISHATAVLPAVIRRCRGAGR
ncbi:MAG: cysteine desulfurase family protein [Limisphaerales bacterium]